MAELEYENKQDFEEYAVLVNHFEFMCSISREKLAQVTEREKSEISELIGDLNPSVLNTDSFKKILNFDEKSIILKRTVSDCGLSFLTLYISESSIQPIDSMYQELFGIEAEENQEDTNGELVNSYMVSDFINSLYHFIQNAYSYDAVEEEERKLLLSWKYKMLFLFSDLESRALLTKFSIPEYPYFTSNVEIQTTGLTEEEYRDNLNSVVIDTIMSILCLICQNKGEMNLFNTILLKSLAALLNNKELGGYFILNYTEEATDETKKRIDEMNPILIEVQESAVQYQKNRKYPTI